MTHCTRDDIVLGYLSHFQRSLHEHAVVQSSGAPGTYKQWLGAMILCTGAYTDATASDDNTPLPFLLDTVKAYDCPLMLAEVRAVTSSKRCRYIPCFPLMLAEVRATAPHATTCHQRTRPHVSNGTQPKRGGASTPLTAACLWFTSEAAGGFESSAGGGDRSRGEDTIFYREAEHQRPREGGGGDRAL